MPINSIYKQKHGLVNSTEYLFFRFWFCSHSIAFETGRWNRRERGRLSVQERLCECGRVQTVGHVVEVCPLIVHFISAYNVSFQEDLLTEVLPREMICEMLHEVLSILEGSGKGCSSFFCYYKMH